MSSRLEIIPLGGLGEFGMNLMLYRIDKDVLIVDAGVMFPSVDHFGVDRLIPDLSFLEDCGTILGVIATHGHEDHIGAIPYLLAQQDVPVFSPPHARALIRSRLTEHPDLPEPRLELLPEDGEALELGPFRVTALAATHSIPQSKMIAVETHLGVVLHTADFKLEGAGSGEPATDLAALARLGERGVLALCCDSTNADQPGSTPGEACVTAALCETLDAAPGRLFVTVFGSNVRRVEALAGVAHLRGRHIALVGSSLQNQVEVAENLGLVRFAPGVRVTAGRAMDLPAKKVVVLATGSQAEPDSALGRIAAGTHREIAIAPGDQVVHSARVIPGNEKRIGSLFDLLLQRGAELVTATERPVHVSGHPSRGDLTRLLELVRPRYLIPIHGQYRQMWALTRLATEIGMPRERVLLARSGDRIGVSETEIGVLDQVPAGIVYIDDQGRRLDREVLRERRRSAEDGIVVAVLALAGSDRRLVGSPEILTRGFVPAGDGPGNGILRDAGTQVARSVGNAGAAERENTEKLRTRVESDLRRFLRRRTRRQPLIVPVIVESPSSSKGDASMSTTTRSHREGRS